jgi:hypothetical protein
MCSTGQGLVLLRRVFLLLIKVMGSADDKDMWILQDYTLYSLPGNSYSYSAPRNDEMSQYSVIGNIYHLRGERSVLSTASSTQDIFIKIAKR